MPREKLGYVIARQLTYAVILTKVRGHYGATSLMESGLHPNA